MKFATCIFCILIAVCSVSNNAVARDGDFLLGVKGGLVILNSSMKDYYNNGFNLAMSGESFQSDKFAITGELNYNNFGSKNDEIMYFNGEAKYKSTVHVGSFDLGVKYYTGNYTKSFVAFVGVSLGYHFVVQSFDNQTPNSTADKNKTETFQFYGITPVIGCSYPLSRKVLVNCGFSYTPTWENTSSVNSANQQVTTSNSTNYNFFKFDLGVKFVL